MITKTYGLYNKIEAVITLYAGKAKIICNFTGGIVNSDPKEPARLTTANPAVQAVIEACPMFNKSIVLLNQSGEDDKAKSKRAKEAPKGNVDDSLEKKGPEEETEKETPKEPEADTPQETETEIDTPQETETEKKSEPVAYNDVTSAGQAVAKLRELGVKVTEMRDVKGILKVMSRLNVAFPNARELMSSQSE